MLADDARRDASSNGYRYLFSECWVTGSTECGLCKGRMMRGQRCLHTLYVWQRQEQNTVPCAVFQERESVSQDVIRQRTIFIKIMVAGPLRFHGSVPVSGFSHHENTQAVRIALLPSPYFWLHDRPFYLQKDPQLKHCRLVA